MHWIPLDDLVHDRIEEFRREAARESLARSVSTPWTLAAAVCAWRTRLGSALMALARWIVPPEVRAAMTSPTGRLDHC